MPASADRLSNGSVPLSIVVPTYNERDRLPELVDAVFRAYASEALDAELIIVDDASKSAQLAKSIAAFKQRDDRIKPESRCESACIE